MMPKSDWKSGIRERLAELSILVQSGVQPAKAKIWALKAPSAHVNALRPNIYHIIRGIGLTVCLIGLLGIIAHLLGRDDILRQPVQLPVATGLFFLGIAIGTILDTQPYSERPSWLWPVRYVSIAIPAAITVYFLNISLMQTRFNLIDLWMNPPAGNPSIISIITILVFAFTLYVFLVSRRSTSLLIYLIDLPALAIFNLNLFALVLGYGFSSPFLSHFRSPVLFITAGLLMSVAMLLGTIPYRGLLHPATSSLLKIRGMVLAALAGGLLILLKGTQDISQLLPLLLTDNAIATTNVSIAWSSLASLTLAILFEMVLLRQTHSYHEISIYDQQLQENWVKRQALIYNIIQSIPSITLNLDEIFQKIVTELGTILQADRCVIARYDLKSKDLAMPRHEYRSSESIPSLLTLLNEKWRYAKDFGWLMEHICDQRRPINFDQDFPILSDETRDVLAELKIQSGLACPLILQNQCFAVLFIQQVREKRVWTVDENELIKSIADQTAIAIYQAELFAQLGRSKEAAETANRKKSEFLAIMSHELRTPLNAIIGYSEMMESGLGGRPLTDKEKKYMSNVINSGRHLLELINEILDVAKVEAGQLSLESRWIDLKTFIMDMKGTIEEMAMKKEVKLVFEIQPNIDGVKADPLRLRQIFFNLLSNAVKFNREGGSITTRISKRNDKFGEWIVCEIQDTGIGIPKNKIPELFKPFSQIDTSYARHTEGTGLGLVLTKHLIELHEGRIFVESKEGVGSTFTVMLPTHQQFPLANSETEPEQDLMLRQPI